MNETLIFIKISGVLNFKTEAVKYIHTRKAIELTRFQPNEPAGGTDNCSTGSITTWAFEKIPRELGLTCNTGPYRIKAEIVKDGGPVGLGYSVTSLVKCRRVVVTLMLPVTRDSVTSMVQ